MKIKFFSTSVLLGAAIMLQAQAPAPEAVYEIKSGIVTTEMDMMGQKIVQKQYFDDYGKKQATESDFGGNKMRTITLDGAQIMINEAEKTATRMPAMMGGMGGGARRINFSKLTDEVIKQFQIKEQGEETVAGKTCKKYSMTMQSPMGGEAQTSTIWVYKGLTLKTAMNSQMGAIEQVATKVEENVDIPASMFTVPDGIQVREMQMGGFGGGGF